MTRLLHLVRKTFVFAIMIALLVSPSFLALAKGKGFKDVVKHIETNYGAKKVRIPLLGLANFAVKVVRPAGVKGFKLAVFEDQNFSAREGATSFDAVMREAYNKDWRPMVQVSSKRDGASHTFIYVKSSGKDVQFALAALDNREAVVLEVKFNPDAAARFLENPKIMGVSLGKSIRGNNAAVASNAGPRPAAPKPSGDPSSVDSAQPAPAGGDAVTERRRDGGTKRQRTGETGSGLFIMSFPPSVSQSLCLSVSALARRHPHRDAAGQSECQSDGQGGAAVDRPETGRFRG